MKVVCRDADGRSGYAAATARSVAELDATALTQRAAAQRAARGAGVAVEPGEYPVVLSSRRRRPSCSSSLGWLAFNGLAHAEGRGALERAAGRRRSPPPRSTSATRRRSRARCRAPSTRRASRSRRCRSSSDGVAHAVVHDLRSAAVAGDGARSTGHARRGGRLPEGAFPTNLVLLGGGAADEAELAAPIERGIYVTRLWYVNAVHERRRC